MLLAKVSPARSHAPGGRQSGWAALHPSAPGSIPCSSSTRPRTSTSVNCDTSFIPASLLRPVLACGLLPTRQGELRQLDDEIASRTPSCG